MMEENDSNKKMIKVLIGIIVILIIVLIVIVITNNNNSITNTNIYAQNQSSINNSSSSEELKISDNEIQVLPTALDKIYNNSSWCGTFQLVWNDMLEELALNGTIKNSQLEIVKNLNKKSFVEDDLSDEYYYKKYGLKSQKLKAEIENAINKKFNEKSDILDMLDWSEDSLNNPKDTQFSKYLFYVMLKREFKFENEFTILDDGTFGTTENVKYFGINSETQEAVRNQVEVLYYNSEDSYAVSLYAKDGEQVILVKDSQGETFEEIYNNVNIEKEKFDGNTFFGTEDTLKVPNLNFKLLKEYKELIGLEFPTNKNVTAVIEEALQTIQFKLDNTGGSIKSEAAIGTKTMAMRPTGDKRNFNFDSEFTIFLKEAEKDKPYFAANISNITLFQGEE